MKRKDHIFDEEQTSGSNTSIWMLKNQLTPFKALSKAMETDVLIVGGGIAGLMTAYELLNNGKRVIIVEDGELGSGETGRTSAHITYSLDTQYTDLESRFGQEQAKLIGDAHKTAIDRIEDLV